MKCKVCDREAGEDGYCVLHRRAFANIIKKYEVWKNALKISWKEYLSEIVENPLTGEWARAVAEDLIISGEKQDVKNS
jgi:hypothetical protein